MPVVAMAAALLYAAPVLAQNYGHGGNSGDGGNGAGGGGGPPNTTGDNAATATGGGGFTAQLTPNVALWASADWSTDIGGNEQERESVSGNAGLRIVW
jgi:outer membrane autotransporter protein